MDDLERIRREENVEQLRSMALVLAQDNQRLVDKLVALQKQVLEAQGKTPEQLALEIAKLEKQLAAAGAPRGLHASSEKRRRRQDAEESKPPQTGHGPREQRQLELVEQVHDLDDADRVCNSCGGRLEPWEGQTDDSDEVDVIERRFIVRRHRRKKYRCGCGGCVETAPGPERWLPGGRYSLGFAIEVAVAKYLDHLPLERQVRQMARQGLTVDSQTLFDQLWRLAVLATPAYERLGATQKCRPLLFVDETGWPFYQDRGETAANARWTIWTLVSDIGVYDEILDGKSAAVAESLLASFEGTVMCDGYIVYECLAKQYPKLRLVHCWAHVRRKFIEAERAFPDATEPILELIGQLFAIERRLQEDRAGLDDILSTRRSESRGVLDAIQAWVYAHTPLPGTSLHSAIGYMAKRWTRLTRFVDDPAVPLTNNAAERALRGPVVGRKNHYGSRSERGVRVAAVLYSLLESAKIVGVDPARYLRAVADAGLAGSAPPLPHELLG